MNKSQLTSLLCAATIGLSAHMAHASKPTGNDECSNEVWQRYMDCANTVATHMEGGDDIGAAVAKKQCGLTEQQIVACTHEKFSRAKEGVRELVKGQKK